MQHGASRRSAYDSSGGGVAAFGALLIVVACHDPEIVHMEPTGVALTSNVAPSYDDGELTIYEVRSALALPIVAPNGDQLSELWQQAPEPFERTPWVTSDDVQVQVTFTLSNLEPQAQNVWVMIDPWNEFGRYQPAITVVDDEAVRDLSGIDRLYRVAGTQEPAPGSGPDGRIVGTFTFEDMNELARDFATVFQVLSQVQQPTDPEEGDPRSTLVNHAFNVRNRSYNSPLLDPYRPTVVPGLTGFDFGLRSDRPVNVALELIVEVRDVHGGRVIARGERLPQLETPATVISSATSL